MTNLWDSLRQHEQQANYTPYKLKKAIAKAPLNVLGDMATSVYDSFKRGLHSNQPLARTQWSADNEPRVEDAFNVASAAMVGGTPGVPKGNSPSTLGMAFRVPKQTDMFSTTKPKYIKEKPLKESKFIGKVPVQEDLFRGDVVPQSYIDAYKIFKLKAESPGEVFPLFIGKTKPIPQGEWMASENLPTKGFADRPGWHAGDLPYASHLMKLDGTMPGDRVWGKVSMPNDVPWQKHLDDLGLQGLKDSIPEGGNYDFIRPDIQGSKWKIGGALKVNELLSDEEVAAILKEHGLQAPIREADSGLYQELMKMLGKK